MAKRPPRATSLLTAAGNPRAPGDDVEKVVAFIRGDAPAGAAAASHNVVERRTTPQPRAPQGTKKRVAWTNGKAAERRTIYFSEGTAEHLDNYCGRTDKRLSSVVDKAVAEYLARYGNESR